MWNKKKGGGELLLRVLSIKQYYSIHSVRLILAFTFRIICTFGKLVRIKQCDGYSIFLFYIFLLK